MLKRLKKNKLKQKKIKRLKLDDKHKQDES
jgi:hypothetical protein